MDNFVDILDDIVSTWGYFGEKIHNKSFCRQESFKIHDFEIPVPVGMKLFLLPKVPTNFNIDLQKAWALVSIARPQPLGC